LINSLSEQIFYTIAYTIKYIGTFTYTSVQLDKYIVDNPAYFKYQISI